MSLFAPPPLSITSKGFVFLHLPPQNLCSPLIERLVTLMAEDNAIEDTIYHLHRALNGGRIDLERFLRVRFFPTPL
jgi:hypothetical protein